MLVDTNRILTELRGLLGERPSWKAFRQIALVLDQCPAAALPVALDYVDAVTRTWPADARRVPRRWLGRLVSGKDEPRLRLCSLIRIPQRALSDDLSEQVLSQPCLRDAEHLDVSANNLGPAAFEALAAAPWPRLKHLDLSGSRPGDTGVEALAIAHMPLLEHLALGDCNLVDADVKILLRAWYVEPAPPDPWLDAEPPPLDRAPLRELHLPDNTLGLVAADAIASAESLRGLHVLNLARNEIPSDGILALAASDTLAGLTDLRVRGNPGCDAVNRAFFADIDRIDRICDERFYGYDEWY